ncbi:MAG: head GIN domain-containing protein [Chitinophagaceae bacterium]
MRNVLTTFVLSVLAVFGLQAQNNNADKPKVTGSGNVITKDVTVSAFDELNIQGVFSVQLTQGSREDVKIEAEDNIQPLFEVRNDGSKLTISMKKDANIDTQKKMVVHITFKNLKSMDLKTVGNISSGQNMNFDNLNISNKSVGTVELKMTVKNLDVDNKSVGNVTLNGSADNAVIKNKGVGNVQAAGFVVQKMDIENRGVGSAEVNAAKELKVKDSFLGKVVNKGAAPVRKMNAVRV